jgi:hypothetical protein
VAPTPLGVLRKNINLKELRVQVAQGCDFKGVMGERQAIEGSGWFQNGKDREAGALYTRQYSNLVNGCQMKVGQKSTSRREMAAFKV